MKKKMNLNELVVDSDGSTDDWKYSNNNVSNGSTEVFFRNIKSHLYRKMFDAYAIMGCVAWLTDFDILDPMGVPRGGVQMIVQKEDFLRPDIGPHKENWKDLLRIRYNNLRPTGLHMMAITGEGVSVGGDASPEAVRCVGNHNSSRDPAFPRIALVISIGVPTAMTLPWFKNAMRSHIFSTSAMLCDV